jgi:beta-lactamase regulating signal transducer with metallopeptidase domain
MIATWILYCALWTLWLSAAAWMTERLLLNARGPVRMVWLSATVLSVLGPIASYVAPRSAPAPTAVSSPPVLPRSSSSAQLVSRIAAAPRSLSRIETWRDAASRADRPLALAWLAISLGVIAYFAGGIARLRFLRRRWQPTVVDGTPVMVSDNTGPALVGVFATEIVIPAWALELDAEALSLMLRHELEHRAAGDTRALALAQTLVVLMPWNVCMWWQLLRLRLAIELDCDARVLRSVGDVGAYGRLLLLFGQNRSGAPLAGAALADHRASELEQRIRRMTQRAPMSRRRAVAVSIVAGAIAVAIGCQLPTPPAPSASPAAPGISKDSAAILSARLQRLLADSSLYASVQQEVRRAPTAERQQREQRDVVASRHWNDSVAKKLFEAQIGVAETRDSAMRRYFEARLDSARFVFDSTVYRLRGGDRMPSSYVDRTVDSLMRVLASLEAIYTRDHPLVRDVRAKLNSMSFVFPDSIAALEPSPGCTSGPGESVVKLLVTNEAAARAGTIVVEIEPTASRGATVEFDRPGMTCSGPGELRLYGKGAFEGRTIHVRSSPQTKIVVVSGSGRILVGPIAVETIARRQELTWTPR